MDDYEPEPQTIAEIIHIDRYASAENLARVSHSPLLVCKLIFAAWPSPEGVRIIRGESHEPTVCERRYAITFVAREYTGASFRQIARAMNADCSVIHRQYTRAKLLNRTKPAFKRMCLDLIATIPKRDQNRTKSRRALQRQAFERGMR